MQLNKPCLWAASNPLLFGMMMQHTAIIINLDLAGQAGCNRHSIVPSCIALQQPMAVNQPAKQGLRMPARGRWSGCLMTRLL